MKGVIEGEGGQKREGRGVGGGGVRKKELKARNLRWERSKASQSSLSWQETAVLPLLPGSCQEDRQGRAVS